MIDHPETAADLFTKLNEALPIAARMTLEVQASLQGQNAGAKMPATCSITALHYMGDDGGIVCQLDLGPAAENAVFASITHLRFDPRLPLARAITGYQKHRVKRLRRQNS